MFDSSWRTALTGMLSASLLAGGAVAIGAFGSSSGLTELAVFAGANPEVAQARPLDGRTLTRDSFIFVGSRSPQSVDDVDAVRWLLDGRQVAVADRPPWTLPGLDGDHDAPFDVASVLDGKHNLTAKVHLRTGKWIALTSAFATQAPSGANAAGLLAEPRSAAGSALPAATAASKAAAANVPTATPQPVAVKAPPKRAPAPAPRSLNVVAGGAFNPLAFNYRSVGDSCARSGSTIKSCTLAPGSGAAVGGDRAVTVTYSNITSNKDGFNLTGHGRSVVEYNWIHRDGTVYKSEHHDGLQFWTGGNTLIRGNWIDGWSTSAIMLKTDFGSISNVTIDSNYLGNLSGYYKLYLCPVDGRSLSYVTVTNNVFGVESRDNRNNTDPSNAHKYVVNTCDEKITYVHTEAQRAAAVADGVRGAAQWVVWNGNRWSDGTPLAPPGGWRE